MYLRNLEENKIYTLTFDVNEQPKSQHIKCYRIVAKLTNSIRIADMDSNEVKWFPSNIQIILFDEVPERYFRKEKLDKLDQIKNKNDDQNKNKNDEA